MCLDESISDKNFTSINDYLSSWIFFKTFWEILSNFFEEKGKYNGNS